jgi:hypothetical protein
LIPLFLTSHDRACPPALRLFVDSEIDHHHFPAGQLPAAQIVLDTSHQGPGIVVLVIDDYAPSGSVEVHMTDQRSCAQLVDHRVQAPGAVAVGQLNDGSHGVS